jgi:hypothetical protein
MFELLAVARCGSAAKRRVGLDFERHPRRFGGRWETDAAVVLSFPERLSQSALLLPPLFAARRTCIGHRRNFDAERRFLLLWGERDWRGTCCVSRWKDPPSSRGRRNLFSAGAPAPEALKFRRVTGADDTTATAGAVGSAVWGARNAPFPERTVQKQKPQPLSRRLRRLIDPCFDQRERLVVACPV